MDNKTQDLSKSFKGLSNSWVAMRQDSTKVIASGKTPMEAMDKASKAGVDNPVLTKIPKSYGTYIL